MAAKTLPGFKRLPGASRRYSTPTGAVISDRQYRKVVEAQGAKGTFSAQRQAIQVRAQRQYNRLLSKAATRAREEGRPASKADIRKSAEFKQAVQDVQERRRKGQPYTEAQEARKRRALETLGYREGIPAWVPVGLSDRYRAGKLRKSRIPKAYRTAA